MSGEGRAGALYRDLLSRQTDTTENITFPQLCWRSVITHETFTPGAGESENECESDGWLIFFLMFADVRCERLVTHLLNQYEKGYKIIPTDTLGLAYSEFSYYDHRTFPGRFMCIKIIDAPVKKFRYNEHPLTTNSII